MLDILKKSFDPSNSNIFRVSFWVIATFLIVQIDTFLTYLDIEIAMKNFKWLILLLPFMVVSLLTFKLIRVLMPFFDFLFSKAMVKVLPKVREISKSKEILLIKVRDFSIAKDNSTLYAYYNELKKDREEKINAYEFSGYLFLAMILNILVKGSIYVSFDFLKEDSLAVMLLLACISFILLFRSVDIKEVIHEWDLDSELLREIREHNNSSFK